MKRKITWIILLTGVFASSFAQAERREIPTVRLESDIEIMAPPQAVWTKLTTGKNLVTWCPMWKSDANSAINLMKVGDALSFKDSWGNGGESIVTFYAKNRELRVAHEPADGSYICQAKIMLTPKGDGTLVHYVEAYTDESSAKDREATAVQMTAEMQGTLKALKDAAEK